MAVLSGIKCYIVNSGKTGTGLSIDVNFSASDGFLDVFVVSRKPLSIMSAEARFFKLPTWSAGLYYWRGEDHHRGAAGAGDLDGRRVSRQQPGDRVDRAGVPVVAAVTLYATMEDCLNEGYHRWRRRRRRVVCGALRRLDETVEILMVERGPYVSYANCGLPYHVGGVIPRESSLLVADERVFLSSSRSMCAPAARRS